MQLDRRLTPEGCVRSRSQWIKDGGSSKEDWLVPTIFYGEGKHERIGGGQELQSCRYVKIDRWECTGRPLHGHWTSSRQTSSCFCRLMQVAIHSSCGTIFRSCFQARWRDRSPEHIFYLDLLLAPYLYMQASTIERAKVHVEEAAVLRGWQLTGILSHLHTHNVIGWSHLHSHTNSLLSRCHQTLAYVSSCSSMASRAGHYICIDWCTDTMLD